MRLICEYNKTYEIFLREVVDYTIKNYGEKLNLASLRTIELKNISEFGMETDGRVVDKETIIVTSRLYDKLPCYDIGQLIDNDDFKIIINTMYHEMGHISDWSDYPNLYYYGLIDETDSEFALPAQFWIEYLAEKRSFLTGLYDKRPLCNAFVKMDWCPYEYNYDDPSPNNYVYLNKALPYFLVSTQEPSVRREYMNKIRNDILVNYINELWLELIKLETFLPFDNVEKLSGLSIIMKKYRKIFKENSLK